MRAEPWHSLDRRASAWKSRAIKPPESRSDGIGCTMANNFPKALRHDANAAALPLGFFIVRLIRGGASPRALPLGYGVRMAFGHAVDP
jgi:hypothetical protein